MDQLNEYAKEIVDRFIKSMGYNPETIDRNKRMAFTKTIRFQQFAARMTTEETELDEALEFPNNDGFDAKGSSSKVVGEKKLSKKASVVKEIFMKKRAVKEELYDQEKDDKDGTTYGKKPKLNVSKEETPKADDKTQAAAVLTGGTTLTGQKRDTVEFDPLLKKSKPGSPQSEPTDTKSDK